MNVTKIPARIWVKPELVRLGKIADVAGNNTVSVNGVSVNLLS